MIEIDDRAVQRELGELVRRVDELKGPVLRRTLTREGRGARTEISRAIRRKYATRNKTIAAGVKVGSYRTTSGGGEVELRLSSRPIGVEQFGAVRQGRRGVMVTIRRGKRVTLAGTFFARGKVYVRVGAAAYPIRRVTGPSVVQMFREVRLEVEARVAERMQAALKSRLR